MKMLRYALVLVAVVLSVAACSKFDRYERNVVFFSDKMLDQEISERRDALAVADRAMAEVAATGDKERIAKAVSAQKEAKLALTIAQDEKVFRETGRRPLRGPGSTSQGTAGSK